jgi:hypothetical protein
MYHIIIPFTDGGSSDTTLGNSDQCAEGHMLHLEG